VLVKHRARLDNGALTRRQALRRAGGVGLSATIGAGLAGLLGQAPAAAATHTKQSGGPKAHAASGCSHYYYTPGHCAGGACPPNYCCYHQYNAPSGCYFTPVGYACQYTGGGCPAKYATPISCCGGA